MVLPFSPYKLQHFLSYSKSMAAIHIQLLRAFPKLTRLCILAHFTKHTVQMLSDNTEN